MMRIKDLHPWKVSEEEAVDIQLWLRSRITMEFPDEPVKYIMCVDVSSVPNSWPEVLYSAVVVYSWPDLKHVETKCAQSVATMPYTSGLLAFREVPAYIAAMEKVEEEPDLVIVDAHGMSHPRMIGASSHFGIILGKPTIGVAKKILCGRLEDNNEVIMNTPQEDLPEEAILASRKLELGMAEACRYYPRIVARKVGSLFISVGTMITLNKAVDTIKYIHRKNKSVLTSAHVEANKYRKSLSR